MKQFGIKNKLNIRHLKKANLINGVADGIVSTIAINRYEISDLAAKLCNLDIVWNFRLGFDT